MSARYRKPNTQRKPRQRGVDRAAVRIKHGIEEPDSSRAVGTKTDHLGRAGSYRCRREAGIVRIITIQHGDPTRFEPEKNFRLRIGDCLNRREEAEMGRLDCSDHGDVGPRQSSETAYLA